MANLLSHLSLLIPRKRAEWSIGIYAGPSPLELQPHPAVRDAPVLTRKSLGPLSANGVADPFIVKAGTGWHMFFEVENRRSGRGEIGLAVSADLLSWQFEGIVLKEPFHLSYPHVFGHAGAHYMVPECAASGAVRLYKADGYPHSWQFHSELVRGDIVDATPFQHAGRWWIIALEGFRRQDAMVIYHSDRLEGPWQPHARNPLLAGNRKTTRPAGRILAWDGQLVRLAQDGETSYGRSVRAFAIDVLTPEDYEEHVLHGGRPILGASGSGWNASGMHHLDAARCDDGEWLACVDGRRTRWTWPLKDRLAARLAA